MGWGQERSTGVGSKGLKRLVVVWLRGGDPHLEEEHVLRQEPVNSSIQSLVHLKGSQNDKVAVGGTQEDFHSNWDLS